MNAVGLVFVIIDIVIKHHSFGKSIIRDWGSLFTSNFWSSPCNLLFIKWKLFTIFYPQTDGQKERQSSIIKIYLSVFVNDKKNN